MNKKLIILLFLLTIGVVISLVVIDTLSKDRQTIPVNIVVENTNPLIGENVSFRLVLGANYPFYIDELTEGGGINILRIPDDIDPSTICKDPSYLSSLSTYGNHTSIGLKDYSHDDKSLLLEWNCTIEQYNPLIDDGATTYVRAPAGHYIIYRGLLNSYNNDNKLEFRATNQSIFHLDGIYPSIHSRYEPGNRSIDVKISANGGIIHSDEATASIGVYAYRNDTLLIISPRYDVSVALNTTVEKYFSNIDVRDYELVYVFARVQYEGYTHSLCVRQMIG